MERYTTEARRFDYAKFQLVIEVDLIEGYINQALLACNAWNTEHGTDYVPRVEALGHVDGGLRKYTIEFQGPSAQAVKYLDFERWAPACTRLDVRIPMEQTEKGLRAFRDYLDHHGTGQRRHGYSDGRIRKKTSKRDSGGKMIYIGSHRSEYRCIIYERGSDNPAIEWMFEGNRVKDAVNGVRIMRDAGSKPYLGDPWGCVLTTLWGRGEAELQKDIALGSNMIAGILRGDYMPDDVVDSIMERIEEQFQALPRSAQLSILEALENMPLQPSREGVEDNEG